MAFEQLSPIFGTYGILVIIIFVLFVLAIKQVMKILKNAIYVAVAAALFPIFANRILGLGIDTDGETIVAFVAAGLVLYFIYVVIKSAYTMAKYGKKAASKVMPNFEKKKTDVQEKKEDTSSDEPTPKRKISINNKLFSHERARSEKKIMKNYIELGDALRRPVKKEIRHRKKKR